MFCGLPIRVAAEPMLAATASASRKGSGASWRRLQASISTGAIARQTMSLLKTADKAAVMTTSTASRRAGLNGKPASRWVIQS